MTLTLYGFSDITGPIAIDGTAVSTSITTPGQNARYTFTGTAGQRVNLGVTGVTVNSTTISLLKPDGTTHASASFGTGGGSLDPSALPVAGTYTVFVNPSGSATGNMSLTLSSELSGAVPVDGTSTAFSTTRPGQNGRFTFDGTAGQRVSIALTNSTIPIAYLSIIKPDGTTLVGPATGTLDSPALPTTGTYGVFVDPYGTYTGSANVWASSELSGTITVDGASVPVSVTRAGQNARYTFTGTAGQQVNLGVTGVTFSTVYVSVLRPDGTILAGPVAIGSSGGSVDPSVLPSSGTYSILVDPYSTSTGNLNLTLSSEVNGTLNIGDPATTVTISRPGQNARYTLNGTGGQQVTVRITSNTIGCVLVALLKPDNTTLTSTNNCSASFNLTTQTLPSTGTYSITVNPSGTNTGTLGLAVTNP
ncbi:hypothetical protein [Candidatus Nitrospira bockiana]